MAAIKPHGVTLRCYNVGFGDCFLLTFHYAKDGNGAKDRHVLIDFGSTSRPAPFKKDANHMKNVASHIGQVCGGKLDAVVATHRHADHVSGFAGKTGEIIELLRPDVVIQPWTEDPDAEAEATGPLNDPGKAKAAFLGSLRNMHQVAEAAYEAYKNGTKKIDKQIAFLGLEGISNKDAVERLGRMGKGEYVYFGSKSGLEEMLPGVKVHVLGPPTLEQSETIEGYAKKSDEYWFTAVRPLARFWAAQAGLAGGKKNGGRLFGKARVSRTADAPEEVRWFAERAEAQEKQQTLAIVRRMDDFLNNTSVILLFEVGGKRLLFPGDAQVENWMYALRTLEKQGKIGLLEEVDLYKVGHHGSLNATPRSLWKKFKKKGKSTKAGRLRAVMSTMPGKHGSDDNQSEVPRKPLVAEMAKDSLLVRTDEMVKKDGLARVVEIPV
jgi:hypothetical protein